MCGFRRCNSFLLILESNIAMISMEVKTDSRFRLRIIGIRVTLVHNSHLNIKNKINIKALAFIKLLATL